MQYLLIKLAGVNENRVKDYVGDEGGVFVAAPTANSMLGFLFTPR